MARILGCRTLLERFEKQVEKTDYCWLWTGSLDRYGYGKFYVDGRTIGAHRWGYIALVGQIPEGLTLDHVCHSRIADECLSLHAECPHRRCVNPDHLEPVTSIVNVRRAGKGRRGAIGEFGGSSPLTHCRRRGHELTPENVVSNGPNRTCRICRDASKAAWRERWAS